MVRPQETLAKKSRKRKPLKVSSGLVEALATEHFEERELESKEADEVQESLVPSQDDPVPNSTEGESLEAPMKLRQWMCSKVEMPLCHHFLKNVTDLMGMLTAQLKPNEAVTSSSIWMKVVKMLSIKIPPPKVFEGTVIISVLLLGCGR